MTDESSHNASPPGFQICYTLREHKGVISQIAWSPDGRMLAASSMDGIIWLWDGETGQLRGTLGGQSEAVKSIAWSADAQTLSVSRNEKVEVWDTLTKQRRATFIGYFGVSLNNAAWSPNGQTLAFGNRDTVRLWNAEAGLLRYSLGQHFKPFSVNSVAWSQDGQTLASAGTDGIIRLWDTKTWLQRTALKGLHNASVNSVAWSPDGHTLASGDKDGIIRLWDTETSELSIILEGHTDAVKSIAFSFDNYLLASTSNDGSVRLWHRDTGKNVAMLEQSASSYLSSGLAFHPKAPVLATLDDKDTVIRIWDLDFDVLLDASSDSTVSYTNAKVVLVGDTGVGKTALGVRLAEGVWRPTPGSTHGMNVWTLHSETEREVMLWDFAGQDEYRLTHQLFMNETNVALLLYDPTKSNDTFFGIDYWEKALKNAVIHDVQKILVAARVDVGGVRLTAVSLEAYCKAHGYLAHIATSAETNEGCDELRTAIMAAIPWSQLPKTSSPEIFKRIKDFLAVVRQGERILVREPDLYVEFNAQLSAEGVPTEAEFRTVIGHVETTGFIKRLSFGDFILLKPEILNGYAADIVDAARRHDKGLGAVHKADVLDGRIRLKDEGGLKQSDKIFMLHATVEWFLRLGLALEQNGNLVFPSKFNQQMPPLGEDPVVEVEFMFEGPVENIYTTMVVRLYYGGIFRLKKLWKNAAEFLNARGQVCGFQLYNEGDGRGTLKVFYSEGVYDDDKALFLKFIADHFKDKRAEVRRQRLYRCLRCREPMHDRRAIEKALKRGAKEMPCLYCDKKIPLIDTLEVLYHDDEKFLSQIASMESRAEASMERGGELISAAAELRTEDFNSWAGGVDIATVAIVFTDVVDSTKLNIELGDEHWRQVSKTHFIQAEELIQHGHGYFVKTIGDSVMAAFHSAANALDFALALRTQPGHKSVKIRAGIHIGAVGISTGDAFGQQVNMAARVAAKAKGDSIWVSNQVKEDIHALRASRHRQLKWTEHPNEELKGFPQQYMLWSVE